jgi:hypothetical protein
MKHIPQTFSRLAGVEKIFYFLGPQRSVKIFGELSI